MLKSYFIIAWRSLRKHPAFSLLNIAGLSAGIALAMLIAAYVWNEWKVNSDLKNAGNQYIIQSSWKDPNQGYELASLGPLAKALRENYPDLVTNYYRYDGITTNISKGDKSFREGLQVGDSTILNMYGFKLLHGNPATALDGVFSVIISSDKAIKYFGKTDVVGQTISIENFSGSKHDFLITGVLSDLERNSISHLVDEYPNGIYVSIKVLEFFGRNMNWDNVSIVGFLELRQGVTPKDLDKPIKYLVSKHAPPHVVDNLSPYLVSLKEYYLVANNGLVKRMLYALSAIATFILLMAVINFVNISVSRSSARMREIGIRKVLGSLRIQLIIQFLLESIVLVFFATFLAIFLFWISRDIFSGILGKEIPSFTAFPFYFALFPLALALIVGLLSGIYPAIALSSLKSVDSLKGKLNTINEKIWLRKSLVVFQFATATIVLIASIIVTMQVNFFFGKNLGYDKEYVIAAQVPRDWSHSGVNRMENIRKQFLKMPEVAEASLSYEIPNGNNSGSWFIHKANENAESAISTQELFSDNNYATTYGIPMVAGEFFSSTGTLNDTLKLVINETQAKAMGWGNPNDAIGREVKFRDNNTLFTVAGVIKDFHFGSMKETIKPVTFLHVGLTKVYRYISFKLKPGITSNQIDALQKQWAILLPGAPFEYKFMDDTLKNLYKTEIQLQKASFMATILSFIIALLGVIGLVSYNIQKRTKEIGIRKILGSSVASIIMLFMKEFLGVICIAGLIACPVALFFAHEWLNDYAYKMPLTPTPFICSIIVLAAVIAIIIYIQTFKAAVANPVKSLRTE
jgi:ABC-type antimicrobial peptide transport system permease subunit